MEHNGEQLSADTHNLIIAQNDGLLTQSLLDKWESKTPLQQEFRGGTSEASDTGKSWFVLKRTRANAT